MDLYDDVAADRPLDAPVLSTELLDGIMKRLLHKRATLRVVDVVDGLWYVLDQTGAVVLIADDTGYTQLTGEEPPS